MHNSIKLTFDDECKSLLIDSNLIKRIQKYNNDFVNKNSEHIEFFGGNLTGVNVVRFTDADRNRWFDEVLEINDGPLEERLLALPSVNADFYISSDTMNLSCVWLTHAIFRSKLPEHQKHDGMINVILALQRKYLTSLLFRYFTYPADRAIAEATYAQLNYKYGIKVYGSWSALLLARAEEIISSTSIHYKTITDMDEDSGVIYMLNDTQGRIRDILKNIYAVFKQVHDQGIRITSTSSLMLEHDGVEILKDKTKTILAYEKYINSIVTDNNSFIRSELTNIIIKLVHTMPPKPFLETLKYISNNYRQNGAGIIEEVLNETLIHSFDYLSHNRNLIKSTSDLALLLSKLKGVYMSSRSSDPMLITLREKCETIVKNATGIKNDSVIASIRTGVLLYIILVSYTMKHYT